LLAKNPDDRYQTADDAKLELARLEEVAGTDTTCCHVTRQERDGETAYSVNTYPVLNRPVRYTLWVTSLALLLGILSAGAIRRFYSPVPPPPIPSFHITVPELALVRTAKHVVIPAVKSVRSTPKHDSQTLERVAVPLEVLHPFSHFELAIWIDQRLAYTNAVRGERKKRFLHLGSSPMPYLSVLQTTVGKHVVRIRVTGGGAFDQTASVEGLFSRNGGQRLQIKCDAPDKLQATIN
jgi:hypothetical protein